MKNKLILLTLSLLLLPIVYAQGVEGLLETGFEMFWNFLQSDNIMFGFVFVLLFMLFYGAIYAALKGVKVFQENKFGKVVAFALSGMMVLSIIYKFKGDVPAFLNAVLSPFGIIGPVALALIMFAIVYFTFKSEEGKHNLLFGLAAASFAIIVSGMVTNNEEWTSWGWFFLFIIGVFGIITAIALRGHE